MTCYSCTSESKYSCKTCAHSSRKLLSNNSCSCNSGYEENTPAWAKATIIGSLGYFIAPLDAIVDLTPVVGYADDLGVLALALATVATYINDEVRDKAALKMQDWFGD